VLEVKGLSKSFGGFKAVSDVDLAVAEGEIAAVIGPNGAGKSTLFNLITGHLQPSAGRVIVDGRDITGMAPFKLCSMGMGRSFQRTNIFPKLSVLENVQAAFLIHRGQGPNFWSRSEKLYRSDSEALLGSIGLGAHAGTTAGTCPTATRSSSSWAWRWPATRRCCCLTSRPPVCRPARRTRRSGCWSASPSSVG